MVLAVEGMDGAGKTTACEYISKHYDFTMIEKPTKYFYSDREGNINYDKFYKALEDVYKQDRHSRALFFGLGNIYAVTDRDKENLVLDRHLVSNFFWNGSGEYASTFDFLVEKARPNFTILLHASPVVRYKRLMKRDPEDGDLYDKDVFLEGEQKMEIFLKYYGMDYVYIDTDELTIEGLYQQLDNIMETLRIPKKEN